MRPLRRASFPLAAAIAVLLAGCAGTPRSPSAPSVPRHDPGRDGPEAVTPPNLHLVPDAEPRLEPLRRGGPNKPYEVLGQRYEPMTADQPLVERGLASWYGRKFHGRSTASGETYNMYAMTAAHPTMPIPSYARVRNPANGREVLVRVNDRGPFHPGRIIDLSYTAALKLDTLRGVTQVEVERLTFEDIRTGAWRRDNPAPVFVAGEAAGAPERSATFSPPPPRVDPAQLLAADEPALPSAPKVASPGYWLQLGAFSRLDGAETLRQRLATELEGLAPLLAIFKDSSLHRLQAGPYPTRDEARQAAERLRAALNLQPVVVRR
ncbi:septal ring lytic transglycosylase RlpA family protein [Roseateles toxinivorans]|uniref:Endolytic peptidoglycan transglycosylase RlpA n=1 Tax=Roseateles toxinivorans TaxID=270368 RepID=A0A4R6QPK6_9BURK|nr:septal ring lytic transglycosylase RlpA family protein [Roseateles toxinivorans]TDP72369.1 rare lipoprotein A [Roseateles toxinivorans]